MLYTISNNVLLRLFSICISIKQHNNHILLTIEYPLLIKTIDKKIHATGKMC
ncbi:hypothetical protein EHRUM1_05380 [Ehrlichia ruminantium]|nr:hypothetical protein EHRUM1_05380 [Ehrlichia ruminantium]